MTQAYGSLADWFECLNDDCGYEEWSQYFIEGLKFFHAGRSGLEVGCGSGYFCRALKRAGYDMTGADLSAPMLTKAAELARKEGLTIPFLQADARTLRTGHAFDFILSPNDCYNYIPQAELDRAFSRAAGCLKKGGLFWFDVSSPCKLREKVANNMFADDREEVTYLSFNRLYGDRVEMNVTLFVKGEDGRFDRFDELHVQYIHEQDEICAALERAGFSVLRVEGHLGADTEGSDRLNFICRKV